MLAESNAVKPEYKDTCHALLTELDSLEKIQNQAINKSGIPSRYREDASQEIMIAWLMHCPHKDRSVGEKVRYCFTIASTVAKKLRRDMDGAVRLPGNAFRERVPGETYVQAGHLAAPVDFDALNEIYASEAINGSAEFEYDTMSDREISERMEFLDNSEKFNSLSRKQQKIIRLLAQGYSSLDVEESLNIKDATVRRSIRNIRANLKTDQTDRI